MRPQVWCGRQVGVAPGDPTTFVTIPSSWYSNERSGLDFESTRSMSTTPVSPPDLSPSAKAGPREWAALAVLMLPVLLVSVDNTVLAFALPEISSALQPTGAQQLWIIDIYPLVLAGLLVAMGSLGDRIGRRRLLLIGSTGFAAVSVAAAYAPSAELLIVARGALGFFGAMLMPSTLSLLRNIFLDGDQRRFAIAIWASCFAAGAALGPIVGGFLLEHAWWGSVFLLAVPVLIPLLVLAPMFVPESKDPNPGRVDVVSIGLSMLALAPLVYAIKRLAGDGMGLAALVPAAVGVLALVLFVVYPVLLRLHGLSPLRWFAGAWPAIQLAFVSRSSIGTLPVTERVTEQNLGVPRAYASFAVPLGATTKMDGCAAIYPALAAIFVAQFFGVHLGLTIPADNPVLLLTGSAWKDLTPAGQPGGNCV